MHFVVLFVVCWCFQQQICFESFGRVSYNMLYALQKTMKPHVATYGLHVDHGSTCNDMAFTWVFTAASHILPPKCSRTWKHMNAHICEIHVVPYLSNYIILYYRIWTKQFRNQNCNDKMLHNTELFFRFVTVRDLFSTKALWLNC